MIEACFGVYTDKGELVKNVVLRFNPCMPIHPDAQAVHHISNNDLMECPKFAEKAEAISKLLSKAKMIVIHNARFDAPMLRYELECAGYKVPEVPVYDTMTESTWATHDGKWPRLGQLCYALGVTYNPEEAHAAEYDVNKMMECYWGLTSMGYNTHVTHPFNQIEPFKRRLH